MTFNNVSVLQISIFSIIILSLFPLINTGKRNRTSEILDITQDCKDNYSTRILLPYGSGSTDARIISLRSISTSQRTCSLFVISSYFQKECADKCMTIIVFEFYNYESRNISCDVLNGGIFLIFGEHQIINVCSDIYKINKKQNKHEMQSYLIEKKNFSINFRFSNFSGTIKITITSTKNLGNYGNCTTNEILCIYNSQLLCINKALECDGNYNCGSPDLYDEYCSNLDVQENILFSVVYGCFLMAVLLFFFVHILQICVPKIAENFFIFTEGEEYKFVLTSQSLPPVRLYKPIEENIEEERTVRATDTQIY